MASWSETNVPFLQIRLKLPPSFNRWPIGIKPSPFQDRWPIRAISVTDSYNQRPIWTQRSHYKIVGRSECNHLMTGIQRSADSFVLSLVIRILAMPFLRSLADLNLTTPDCTIPDCERWSIEIQRTNDPLIQSLGDYNATILFLTIVDRSAPIRVEDRWPNGIKSSILDEHWLLEIQRSIDIILSVGWWWSASSDLVSAIVGWS